ncbi:SDR family oxidoreductase [Actinocrispum wychmicini]|uniref:Uncharacterized protein YbjT (DUF2867 family) n=1 Tax=Actinocrispum wychmicini TaxID=1213861 RepID=A0A4R2JNS5_9PSEU|nr:NAD(P)H-binding protein [Actinocrispum wychmicini]TCO58369.1 uncharacterized protein YbjT (DUF2867 family) [Actinocrispum wychmicini]
MTVLVTGATGNVGRNVVDLLLAEGVPVRAASRTPSGLPAGVDVRTADLTDPGSFVDVFDGVDKVFLFPNPAGVQGVVAAAKTAGVQHIVLLSSIATAEPNTDNMIAQAHLAVESAVRNSGIAWTFVRPGFFATNTFRMAPVLKKDGGIRIPYAQAEFSPIHEHDIAAVAAVALLNEGHEAAAYPLTGPESITQAKMVELIGQAVGRQLWVEDVSGDEAEVESAKSFPPGTPPEIIKTMLGFTKAQQGRSARVEDTTERLLGRPARTYAEWAVDHKAAFA